MKEILFILSIISAIALLFLYMWQQMVVKPRKQYAIELEINKKLTKEFHDSLKEMSRNDFPYLYEVYGQHLIKHCNSMIMLKIGNNVYWNSVKLQFIKTKL